VDKVAFVACGIEMDCEIDLSDFLGMCSLKSKSVQKGVCEVQIGVSRGDIINFQVCHLLEIQGIGQSGHREARGMLYVKDHGFVGLSVDAEGLVEVFYSQERVKFRNVDKGGVDGVIAKWEEMCSGPRCMAGG